MLSPAGPEDFTQNLHFNKNKPRTKTLNISQLQLQRSTFALNYFKISGHSKLANQPIRVTLSCQKRKPRFLC